MRAVVGAPLGAGAGAAATGASTAAPPRRPRIPRSASPGGGRPGARRRQLGRRGAGGGGAQALQLRVAQEGEHAGGVAWLAAAARGLDAPVVKAEGGRARRAEGPGCPDGLEGRLVLGLAAGDVLGLHGPGAAHDVLTPSTWGGRSTHSGQWLTACWV